MIGLIDCRSRHPQATWAGVHPEMLEFFDRPLLQHAVEQMVQSGVTHCVLITEDTSAVMKRWGTGERWGCTFSAIPSRTIVSFLVSLGAQPLMVGRGDCIPYITETSTLDMQSQETQLIFRQETDNRIKQKIFTGWAITQPHVLLNSCFATHGAHGLLSLQNAAVIQTETCLCCDSPKAFLKAQERVLQAVESALIFHGMQIQPGVWAARNVVLHPTTRILGKVYLGENVRIGAHVTLMGPLVICRGSAIDDHAVVVHSSVQPDTYVGRGMNLQDDVTVENKMIGSNSGVSTRVFDSVQLARADTKLWHYAKTLFRLKVLEENPG